MAAIPGGTAMDTRTEESRAAPEVARYLAAAAAAIAAGLYALIGLGVLSVGTDASGGKPDLFAFGAMAGATFAVAAVLVLASRSRLVGIGVAIWSAVVIVAYVAFADLRTPPFEVWGLSVKAAQAVLLGAALYLAMRSPQDGRKGTSR